MVQVVTGDSQEKVMILRDKQTLHHNIYIIIIIVIIIKVCVGAMVDRKEGLISVPVVENLLRTCGLPTNGQLPFINSPQPNWMNVSKGQKSFFSCASNNASLNSELLLCIILDFEKVS